MRSNEFVSIDPGKKGALVLWRGGEPVDTHQFSVKKGQRFFDQGHIAQLASFLEGSDYVVMEGLLDRAMPRQSAVHTNTAAVNWGILYGECVAWQLTPEIVRPGSWKRRLGLSKDKEQSLVMARELYPDMGDCMKLKKNNDIAEAMLIGYDYLTRTT